MARLRQACADPRLRRILLDPARLRFPARMNRFLPRPLFDAIYEMNAAQNHADFVSAVIAGLGRLIRADLCVIHVLDRRRQRLLERMAPFNPFTPAEIAHYVAHPSDYALVAHYERTGETVARRISDVVAPATFLASEHYRICLSRLRLRHGLALPIVVDGDTVAGVAFNRSRRDFTQRDCALLDAFAPHFRLAWQRHADPWAVVDVPSPELADHALTPRESDILYWITAGKQNREIATILGISLFTVQKHVANILRKLDVENRHALTVITLNRATGR